MCRALVSVRFPSFCVEATPKLKMVASMVERHKENGEKKGKEPEEPIPPSAPSVPIEGAYEGGEKKETEFHCSFQPIRNRVGDELTVGKLSLEVVWPDYSGDISLFIPIIDKSGSMNRSFKQVQEALLYMHFLTFQNR